MWNLFIVWKPIIALSPVMIHQINLTCLFISLLFIQDQMTEEEEEEEVDIGRNLTRDENFRL